MSLNLSAAQLELTKMCSALTADPSARGGYCQAHMPSQIVNDSLQLPAASMLRAAGDVPAAAVAAELHALRAKSAQEGSMGAWQDSQYLTAGSQVCAAELSAAIGSLSRLAMMVKKTRDLR